MHPDDIINESFDIAERDLEIREVDPSEPDALARAQALRPQPHPASAAREQASTEFIDRRCDQRIAASFGLTEEMDPNVIAASFAQGAPLRDAFGGVIADLRQKFRTEMAIEVEALYRELAACRREIRALKTKLAATQKITSWSVDYKNFQATPFYNAVPGTSLDLYPLFAMYHQQVAMYQQ
jgi:hypothetical protein